MALWNIFMEYLFPLFNFTEYDSKYLELVYLFYVVLISCGLFYILIYLPIKVILNIFKRGKKIWKK